MGGNLRSQLVCPLFLLVQVRISLSSLPDRQGSHPVLGEVRAVTLPYNPCSSLTELVLDLCFCWRR